MPPPVSVGTVSQENNRSGAPAYRLMQVSLMTKRTRLQIVTARTGLVVRKGNSGLHSDTVQLSGNQT